VPVEEEQRIDRDVRKIQGFRKWRRGALDAGRLRPASRAGRDPQERRGEGSLLVSFARGTRALRRASFDARTRGSTRLPPKETGKRRSGEEGWRLLIFCARATRGLEGPRWTRAVEDQSAPIPHEVTSELGEIYFYGGVLSGHACPRKRRGAARSSFLLAERAR
jgi:hypothetical protein